jgi:hypothetical protein
LIGGFALQSKNIPKFDAKVISDVPLDEIPKILRTA